MNFHLFQNFHITLTSLSLSLSSSILYQLTFHVIPSVNNKVKQIYIYCIYIPGIYWYCIYIVVVSNRLRGMIYMSKPTTISYAMIGSFVRRLQLNYNDSALKCLQICTNNCKDKFPFIGRNNEHVMYKLGSQMHAHTHTRCTN